MTKTVKHEGDDYIGLFIFSALIQKSKTGTALDSWWKEKSWSTTIPHIIWRDMV